MNWREKYNKMWAGILSGFLLPLLVGIIIFLFTAKGKNIGQYLSRIEYASILTHAITLCVFPNIAIFLLFLRFDMLRTARGVLAITIAWAVVVFIIKLF